ncbi:glycine zipper 2TM domain-containing protein [uncultured Sphingomonas sp.]|uniref:glycine zipper 2TM domain-containing protein n=1 Tax=uncultured Sphingomonas sp. TaxID=158754 RepID=UPI0035CA4FE5
MFRQLTLGAVLLTSLAVPATAQTASEQRRWDAAQRRFQQEQTVYDRERGYYDDARRRSGAYRDQQYRDPRYDQSYDDSRYATTYDASRDYRDDPRYQERRLSANDQVYRGSDGRYYCKRSDGTTGLIIGGAAGGVLGNVVDGGRNRVAGTLIGGALGALLGKSVDQQNSDVRCR